MERSLSILPGSGMSRLETYVPSFQVIEEAATAGEGGPVVSYLQVVQGASGMQLS